MYTDDTKPKVLYLDDEEENLLVFTSSFRRYYDISAVQSVTEAREISKNISFDIIISDQRMPDITGVEFLKSIPGRQDDIRIILTGYSDIEAVIDALNTGKIYKFIKKPWEKEELKTILDEAIIKQAEKKKENGHNKQTEEQINIPGAQKPVNAGNKEEIEELKKQVNEAYQNVQLLSEIGQEITSSLNLDAILNTVYESVNQLMDATVFGIGIFNEVENVIDYRLAIEKGKRYQPYTRSMEDKNQFPVWCIENKKEIFINDVEKESGKYIKGKVMINQEEATMEDGAKGEIPTSIIYMPLMVKEKVIGLITAQSFNKNAYNQYHLNNLRNIAIYVSTALENAKAYKLIEEQKAEIQQKNIELEQKVEKRTEQLRIQNDELDDTYSKLKLLTEIGKEITSTLDLNTILNTIYENVNNLMDASVFGIGIYNEAENAIDYRLAIENGKRYQPYSRSMEDKNQFPVWSIENKKEIFINDIYKEYSRYIKEYKSNVDAVILDDGSKSTEPLSLIYIPLLFNNKPIGVVSVQSFRKYAYNQYHLDILRSLASYITTAIQNANSYTKMITAFEQLKTAQSKLVESEKMASLGVLTAGVAHEINNPVNFISGGIQSLEENYADVQSFLQLLMQYYADGSSPQLRETIDRKKAALQLDKLMPEMEALITSIKNGANRTSEIVRGLRNFSRLDESDMKKANLEEGIDNTLVILNNQLKNRVHIIKEYGKIPELMCFPGQLNQVFMNILYNATDAIQVKGDIHIKTWQEKGSIKIAISDTGKGMPESIRSRIFEPFFTTKPVGKGTGLGLSIAYGIIEKHKGNIDVQSEEGKGTTFTLTLPVK